MGTVVKRRILQALSDAEDKPHSTVAGMALGDHLYGANLDDVSFSRTLSDAIFAHDFLCVDLGHRVTVSFSKSLIDVRNEFFKLTGHCERIEKHFVGHC